ncbi:MAG TPA: LemA family protein [Tenericutes bacterium]|jgi:LemA protein|nr:LemA family protein [Mycoplasmatota bacterium]
MDTTQIVLLVIIAIIVLLILYVIGMYNTLVRLRNRVEDQWAQIDVQLKRRADLVPNLVETVKGYASHEESTLEAVISARNKFQTATTPEAEIEASGELTRALSRLFALSESYPELKANTNFLNLQEELSQIEEKIAYARQFYNDTVLTYKNKLEVFPSNIIAGMFKFEKKPFFEAEEAAKEAPKVSFK